jgi:hypothetical protein
MAFAFPVCGAADLSPGAAMRAGYHGDVEVEIFNEAVWAADGHAVIETIKRRYRDLVLPALSG